MKKALCILLCLPILFLNACGGIYENFREIERLSVVSTMGIDRIPGGVKLCFAASSLADGETDVLSGSGDSIEAAMEDTKKRSGDRELFCRQTEYILIGESSAKKGMDGILAYIGRSPLMRIDTPLYIVRGADAGALMQDCSSVSEVMAGIVENSAHRGDSSVTTAAEVMRNILSRGSALVSALELRVGAGEEGGKTAVVNGCAVVKGGKAVGFLTEEQTVGAGFLTGKTGPCMLTVSDSRGGKAVLGITGGRAELVPVWGEDGSVSRVNILATVQATVDELSGSGDLDNAAYVQHLTGQLEAGISERINSVLRLSASLGADFLGIGESIRRVDPERYRLLSRPFEELLPVLEVQVSVRGTINHTNDMEGSVPENVPSVGRTV